MSVVAIDSTGHLYFVDNHFQRIYRWSPTSRNAVVVRDAPLDHDLACESEYVTVLYISARTTCSTN
jgi:hypothetical protein